MFQSNTPSDESPLIGQETPDAAPAPEPFVPQWGPNAPRGARAVFSRIIKEDAKVPLFLAQTFATALRDLGYNDTISAICDPVDNALEAGADEVRVYFHERGRRRRRRNGDFIEEPNSHKIDIVILDTGSGMSPNVLPAVMAFGGSTRFDNRSGIGRFGTGMKAAGLSLGPKFDVISWQEPGAFYTVTLDVEAIGNEKGNVVYVPEPLISRTLPAEVISVLTSQMSFPKRQEDQDLFATDATELEERLGSHGTIVYVPDCDRLTYRTVRSLAEHATKEMARVYRRFIDRGVRIYVNNRRLEPLDPTYRMPSARHVAVVAGEDCSETQSRLVYKWDALEIPITEDCPDTRPIKIKLFLLPLEEWEQLSYKAKKNDLRLFEDHSVSFMRADRELSCSAAASIAGKHHSRDYWWRLEIDFPGDLDEAFGVNVNKQGVRPKDYVAELIRKAIHEQLVVVKNKIDRFLSDRAAKSAGSQLLPAEQRANEAEALQATLLPEPPAPRDEAEAKELDANLRALAKRLKREDEAEEAAYERVKASRYITVLRHEPEWDAFYMIEVELGKVILTVNKAHAFYEKLYRPLSELGAQSTMEVAPQNGDATDTLTVGMMASEALTALHLFLLSLGRTQSVMTANNGELRPVFDRLRKQWGANLAEQLNAK